MFSQAFWVQSFNAKSPRVENSVLESLSSSLKKTSEFRSLLLESQKEMLKLIKAETTENLEEEDNMGNESPLGAFIPPQNL